jgi:uncharacterized membrane protein YsdA (DUF1294 family)/ribosomal protein L40E
MAFAMVQTNTCPLCNADIAMDALCCSNCGSVSLRCPKCGTVNADELEFCTRCGGALKSNEAPDSTESDCYADPYVAWEGFPFAWLQRVSQTRDQYFKSLAPLIAVLIITSVIVTIILVPAALNGDPTAGPAILAYVVALILITIVTFARWWVGRKEAEFRRRRTD